MADLIYTHSGVTQPPRLCFTCGHALPPDPVMTETIGPWPCIAQDCLCGHPARTVPMPDAAPLGHEPWDGYRHPFRGRSDRDCETCGRADRADVHQQVMVTG